jgi:hypothetical protein
MSVPLNLPKRFIQQKLSKLLAAHHKRKRGQRTFKESRALYPIATQFNFRSLKTILDSYDLQRSDLRLWEIGQELKLNLRSSLTKDELHARRGIDDPVAVSKKNVLAVAAGKKVKHAKSIIKGVGRGVFPAFAKGT